MTSALRRFAGSALVFAALAGATGGVSAHPHIFIDARGDVLFEGGAVTGMRHHWTFDQYFSAWAIQGLDADGDGVLTPEELQPLADENIVGLDFYNFYTFPQGPDGAVALTGARDPSMVFENGEVTLSFTVDFASPQRVGRSFDIEVADPEYYAAFTFEGADAVLLVGAPDACTRVVNVPQMIDPVIEEQLFMLGPDVTELPEELREAVRALSNVVEISCPAGVAETGLQAISDATAVAPRRPPFVAPPAEPVIAPDQGGLIGWIGTQQRSFYQAMTGALSALHEDNNAFWVLGALSFLYGVFHAAGPGHGKVVISSYVLASESQLRRGIVLSFASALVQAVVAVAFVLVAAGVLRLTSMAMSYAANWLAVGSYGLIAVLGAWLAARKILGFGHKHDHHHHHDEHGHHHHHDHGHGEACDHHVVRPEQAGGDWRAALGVVLSVGMRPCSGALVVLVFALTQDLLIAGIVATFMMALGTGLTVAVLASLAVGAKGLTTRLTGGGALAGRILWWLELAGALVIMGFGLLLLFASL